MTTATDGATASITRAETFMVVDKEFIEAIPPPPPAPTVAPTFSSCDDPKTCDVHISRIINDLSSRMGTLDALDDPSSPQYQARDWIIEECDAATPIDPCDVELNEQRYALAVVYFGLGGDSWNAGANPGLDRNAPQGQWMSGLNYCKWGAEIPGQGAPYNQLVCDEFGNVLNLNLRKYDNF
jgi:hypothetical protein